MYLLHCLLLCCWPSRSPPASAVLSSPRAGRPGPPPPGRAHASALACARTRLPARVPSIRNQPSSPQMAAELPPALPPQVRVRRTLIGRPVPSPPRITSSRALAPRAGRLAPKRAGPTGWPSRSLPERRRRRACAHVRPPLASLRPGRTLRPGRRVAGSPPSPGRRRRVLAIPAQREDRPPRGSAGSGRAAQNTCADRLAPMRSGLTRRPSRLPARRPSCPPGPARGPTRSRTPARLPASARTSEPIAPAVPGPLPAAGDSRPGPLRPGSGPARLGPLRSGNCLALLPLQRPGIAAMNGCAVFIKLSVVECDVHPASCGSRAARSPPRR